MRSLGKKWNHTGGKHDHSISKSVLSMFEAFDAEVYAYQSNLLQLILYLNVNDEIASSNCKTEATQCKYCRSWFLGPPGKILQISFSWPWPKVPTYVNGPGIVRTKETQYSPAALWKRKKKEKSDHGPRFPGHFVPAIFPASLGTLLGFLRGQSCTTIGGVAQTTRRWNRPLRYRQRKCSLPKMTLCYRHPLSLNTVTPRSITYKEVCVKVEKASQNMLVQKYTRSLQWTQALI